MFPSRLRYATNLHCRAASCTLSASAAWHATATEAGAAAPPLTCPCLPWGQNARYPGYIAWCEKHSAGYRIGVALIDEQTLFGARMGEQVCQIEHFSRLQQQQSQYPLDLQALALEWVTHHAVEFSQATMEHAMVQAVLD